MEPEVYRFRAGVKRSLIEEETEVTKKPVETHPVKKTVDEYCDETSLTPVTFLNKGHNIEQNYIWAVILFLCLLLCIYLIKLQYDRWQRTPLFLSMETLPGDVSDIPFPAVTICPEPKGIVSTELWFQKYVNFSMETVPTPKPDWLNNSMHNVFRTFWHVCGTYQVTRYEKSFVIDEEYNLEDALNSILPPFEEYIPECKVSGEPVDCRAYFDKIYTREGICYTFNGLNATEIYREGTYQHRYFFKDNLIRNKSRPLDWSIGTGYHDPDKANPYPMRGTGAGYFAGIDLSLTQNESNLDRLCRFPEEGFKVSFHSPDEAPETGASYYVIPYGLSLAISVTPIYTHTQLSNTPAEIRRCYFPHERHLRFFNSYNRINCDAECLANYTLTSCLCVPFFLPRLLTTKVCNEQSINCYELAIQEYIYYEFVNLTADVQRCNCLGGCSNLRYNYLATVFDDPFAPPQNESYFKKKRRKYRRRKYARGDGVTTPVQSDILLTGRLAVYFKSNKYKKMKQYEYYGLIDFLASCAGLISFFIGFSIICIGEWLYFSTVRLANNFSR